MKVIERIVYPWDECAWPGEARIIRKEERMSQTRRQTWSAGSVVVSRGIADREPGIPIRLPRITYSS